MYYLLLMTLKKVGKPFSLSSSSHRVSPLKELVSDCSNVWASKPSTACSLFFPSSLMPYIHGKQKKKKKDKTATHPYCYYCSSRCTLLKEGIGISGSCKVSDTILLLSTAKTTSTPVPSPPSNQSDQLCASQ